MWQTKVAQVLTLLMAPIGLAAAVGPVAFGKLGTTLEQAQKTDFFQFFNMEKTGETKQGDKKTVTFQPSGAKFHDLAKVNMMLDSKGNIVGAELVLQRSFVDSSADGIFARDIAKSFLRDSVNSDDLSKVDGLAREIDQLTGSGTTVILHKDTVQQAPSGPPSDGYRVYLGQKNMFDLALPHGQTLRLENKAGENNASGGKVLQISYRLHD
jgi:hypothetical protein